MNKEIEIWVRINGYPDYEISSYGNARSWRRSGAPQSMKLEKDKDGYMIVTVRADSSKPKKLKVHRLVCAAFHENPENKPTVNHKDCNRSNNHKDNLEWATWKENAIYGNRVGFRVRPEIPAMPGALNPRALRLGQYDLKGNLIAEFDYIKQAEQKLGFPASMIRQVTKGRRPSYKGFIWKILNKQNENSIQSQVN